MLFSWIGSKVLDRALSGAVLVMGIAMLLLYVFQRRLIYMPGFPPGSRQHVWRPDRVGLQYRTVTIRATDGVKTVAYYMPAMAKDGMAHQKPTVFFCHANAGNMGHRLPIIRRLRELVDCNVFMLSYRGYGESEGYPDEAGIKLDVQAGFAWLVGELGADYKGAIVAYGQSIGGAVAMDIVAKNPSSFKGIIVENTFTSLPELVPHIVPLLRPFTVLCHQKWASDRRLEEIAGANPHIQVLILSGLSDKLIPPSQSAALYDIAKKNDIQCELRVFEKGTHNDTVLCEGYFEAVANFIERLE